MFGTRVALAGALVFAVHTTQLFYEISILSEAFFVCLLALRPAGVCSHCCARPRCRGRSPPGSRAVALTMTRPIAE